MKLIDYERIKEKFLEKSTLQKQEYESIELEYNEMINDEFDKILKIGIPMVMVYLGISFLAKFNFISTILTDILPLWSLPIIHMSSTLITGVIAKKIREKKVGKDTKTYKEKYIKKIKLAIELEKNKKRESIFYLAYMDLKSEIDTISKMSQRYDLREKEENITFETVKSKIEQKQSILGEYYRNLDFFITKDVIRDKMSIATTFESPLIRRLFIFTSGLLFVIIPFETINYQNLYGLRLISFIIGLFGTKRYIINKMKSTKILFNRLNKELFENGRDNDYTNLNNKIDELVKKIIEEEIELAKYEYRLNSLTIQNANLARKRILPRKEVIKNKLPKKRILGINRELKNKKYISD